MTIKYEKVEGPIEIRSEYTEQGLMPNSASVGGGRYTSRRWPHTGDLTVQPGGTGVIRGMVNGTVFNSGGSVKLKVSSIGSSMLSVPEP